MISSIVTYGFGNYGSVNLIPTYGFNIAVDVSLLSPVVDIEVNSYIIRSYGLSSLVNRSFNFNVDIHRIIEFRGDL